jgi:methionyl-tRNA formyltransferase
VRWILCGKNGAAVDCLEFLTARGDEVWAIGTRDDSGLDGWQPSLRAAAERLDVPFDQPRRINAPELVERLARFGARALISIQYDQILNARFFETIGCPCLNLHFALLPRHRGVAPIAWAILSGDREAGVTLHHMLPAIDAGDVIAQRSAPIGAEDSARDVYEKVARAATGLFRESYPFSDSLLAGRIAQDERGSSYHRAGELDFSRRQVEWSQPVLALQRWLRAMIFPPLQLPETRLGDRLLWIARVAGELGAASDAAPGTVVARRAGGIDVAADDGTVRIIGLSDPALPELGPDVVLAAIRIGDRLA